MGPKTEIVSKLATLLIDHTKNNKLEWEVGHMDQETGDFRAQHKNYLINLEGIYTLPKENYFRFRLIPRYLLERLDKQIGFRTYRISNTEQPETYNVVSKLAQQIRQQLDNHLLAEVAAL